MTTIPDAAIEAAARAFVLQDTIFRGLRRTWEILTPKERQHAIDRVAPIVAAAVPHLTSASQLVIDEHMQQVAHRVMDVFGKADDDALAEEVLADVFTAIGLTEAFGAAPSAPRAGARRCFHDPLSGDPNDASVCPCGDEVCGQGCGCEDASAPQAEGDVREALIDLLAAETPGWGLTKPWSEYVDAILSKYAVVPVGEVERLRDVAVSNQTAYERAAEGRATAETERDAALAALEAVRALAIGWIRHRDEARANRYDTPAHHWRGADGEAALAILDRLASPSTVPARLLSGVHVGREVVLPDGTRGVLRLVRQTEDFRNQCVLVVTHPGGGLGQHSRLAPDDVVTLVDEEGRP